MIIQACYRTLKGEREKEGFFPPLPHPFLSQFPSPLSFCINSCTGFLSDSFPILSNFAFSFASLQVIKKAAKHCVRIWEWHELNTEKRFRREKRESDERANERTNGRIERKSKKTGKKFAYQVKLILFSFSCSSSFFSSIHSRIHSFTPAPRRERERESGWISRSTIWFSRTIKFNEVKFIRKERTKKKWNLLFRWIHFLRPSLWVRSLLLLLFFISIPSLPPSSSFFFTFFSSPSSSNTFLTLVSAVRVARKKEEF